MNKDELMKRLEEIEDLLIREEYDCATAQVGHLILDLELEEEAEQK